MNPAIQPLGQLGFTSLGSDAVADRLLGVSELRKNDILASFGCRFHLRVTSFGSMLRVTHPPRLSTMRNLAGIFMPGQVRAAGGEP